MKNITEDNLIKDENFIKYVLDVDVNGIRQLNKYKVSAMCYKRISQRTL